MKTALIYDSTYAFQCNREVYLLENIEDLLEFQKYIQQEVQHAVSQMLKDISNGFDPQKLDHWSYGLPIIDTLVSFTFRMGYNPFWEMPKEIDKLLMTIYDVVIEKRKTVILNKKFSWRELHEDDKILEKYDSKLGEKLELIRADNNFIQLENDPVLDEGWREAFYNYTCGCTEPSVITKLRSWSHEDLHKTLQEYVNSTPYEKVLCQYTTGSDIQQMRNYLEICSSVGIKRAVFYFSAGVSSELEDFIDSYEDSTEIIVKCLNYC